MYDKILNIIKNKHHEIFGDEFGLEEEYTLREFLSELKLGLNNSFDFWLNEIDDIYDKKYGEK